MVRRLVECADNLRDMPNTWGGGYQTTSHIATAGYLLREAAALLSQPKPEPGGVAEMVKHLEEAASFFEQRQDTASAWTFSPSTANIVAQSIREAARLLSSQNVGAEEDAARYRARREAAFQSHTTEQIAVRNVPLERAEFNAGYDDDSDAACRFGNRQR